MIRLWCQNEYCIYQKEGTCILESVELDMRGNCVDCIWIDIEKETRNELKDKLLRKHEALDLTGQTMAF